MESFRKEILRQIERIERGRIFTFRDLKFSPDKANNVAALLYELSKKGYVERVEKGAYYRPKESLVGLGPVPVYQDELLRYLNEKFDGYLSGTYAYNKMGLTEQMPRVITIAMPNPVPHFFLSNLYIKCMKSYYTGVPNKKNVHYLRVLDAIKDIKRISGATPQKVYDRLKQYHFDEFSLDELRKIVSLAKKYPPRVRKTVADMLGDLGQDNLQAEMSATLNPKTRYNLSYKRHKV